MTSPDAVIATEALRKEFRSTVAVADLSLTVHRGEVFGFLGPNGAGKTTAIKMLLGLVAPTSGRGMLLGAPLGDRRARARVGFLPEHFRFHEHLTAEEFLRIHGRLHGLTGVALERRVQSLLDRVGLQAAANRRLIEFSKGMLQRAGLAQALIAEPELVFLDEPTSGLDPFGRVLVRELIAEIRKRGATVFLNSHLLGEVEQTCDRVAFLSSGRVVHELSLADPEAALEVELKIDAPHAEILEGLNAFGTDIRLEGETIRLRPSSAEAVPEIARWLVGRGIAIHGLGTRRKSLEEWFIEVMDDGEGRGHIE